MGKIGEADRCTKTLIVKQIDTKSQISTSLFGTFNRFTTLTSQFKYNGNMCYMLVHLNELK